MLFRGNVFISVVSHDHLDTIISLNILPSILAVERVRIVLLDNLSDKKCKAWCEEQGIVYLCNTKPMGFGENNNKVFEAIQHFVDFDLQRDWFITLNPDVNLSPEMLKLLIDHLDDRFPLCAINLYKDHLGLVSDNSVRRFPSFMDFVSSLLFGINNTKIDKSQIDQPCDVDWAAGSFLIFKASHYARLGGFDTSYFMYCEDIDICFRSFTQFGCRVRYLPHIKARHLAQHGNRRIFSKHFYWHVTSTLRFLWRSRKFKAKSH